MFTTFTPPVPDFDPDLAFDPQPDPETSLALVGNVVDPDSMGTLDPDAKMTHKNINKFHFLSAGCSLFSAEGFSCRLDILYGGLGTKLQFLI